MSAMDTQIFLLTLPTISPSERNILEEVETNFDGNLDRCFTAGDSAKTKSRSSSSVRKEPKTRTSATVPLQAAPEPECKISCTIWVWTEVIFLRTRLYIRSPDNTRILRR